MITFKGWYNFSAVAALLVFSLDSHAVDGFSYRFEPDSIQPGESVILTVEIDKIPDRDEEPSLRDDLLTAQKKILVLDRQLVTDENRFRWVFRLTAYEPGKASVPPLEIQYLDRSFSTEAKEITIQTSRHEQDTEIRPEFEEASLPIDWKRFYVPFFIIAGIGLFCLWLSRKWPKSKTLEITVAPPVPSETAEEWLAKEIERLRIAAEFGGNHSGWIDDFSLTIRRYFSKVTQNPVEAWTTREFIAKLTRDPKAQAIAKIFEQCDQVKYRPQLQPVARIFLDQILSHSEKTLLPWTN